MYPWASLRAIALVLPVLFLVAACDSKESAGAAGAKDAVVSRTADIPFDSFVANLRNAVAAGNLVVVKEVPFQQMLGMAGVNAEQMLGFEVFHPRYGKVIYNNDKSAFKEAPLRIFVRASGGKTVVEYRKPSATFASYSGLTNLGKELDTLIGQIIDRAASAGSS